MKLTLYFLMALLTISQGATAATLCKTDEVAYFSCVLKGGKKIVSLCGNTFWNTTESKINPYAWLEYRFGTLKHIELLYPSSKVDSIKKFAAEYHHPYQGFYYALGFTIDNTRYDIEHIESEVNFYGVSVQQGQKTTNIPCQGKPELPVKQNTSSFFDIVIQLAPQ